MSEHADEFDVVIVGAGPGGIAAAAIASEAGQRVALIDDSPFAGGQIWRNQGRPVAAAARWISRLNRVTQFQQSRVVAAPDAHALLVETPRVPRFLRWKSLVLATGARELFLPFPGWTLPGVVGAGGIQALVKQGYPVRGRRIVVAGTGPLLLAVADLLRAKGAVVPTVLEQATSASVNRFALSLLGSPSKLLQGIAIRSRFLGTRFANDSYPTAVNQTAAGLRVEYRSRRKSESIDCDHLACGFGLIPNNELPQLLGCKINGDGFVCVDASLHTSVRDIFAVGELTGIGGVDKALAEGERAARAIIRGDDSELDPRASSRSGRPAGARFVPAENVPFRGDRYAGRFTRRLAKTFALRPELLQLAKPDTIICRCEDVPLSAISHSLGARDAKLQTRCGMGPCQGRVCGPILERLFKAEPAQVRPPLFATPLATLAGERDASGG